MNKLERLMQDEDGTLYRDDGDLLSKDDAILVGKITTLVVANPCIDISRMIDEMTERKSVFIPEGANAYVASDFSGDTQHLRKSDLEGHEKFYSVFAVQFYYACKFFPF
ncbi:MAG TPA: hypothetical protein VJH68_01890 [Candidatus Nanoarchaeia archaeon]|nr:hypothetical protein [Candidatus Nanoarchaeia archaeon]